MGAHLYNKIWNMRFTSQIHINMTVLSVLQVLLLDKASNNQVITIYCKNEFIYKDFFIVWSVTASLSENNYKRASLEWDFLSKIIWIPRSIKSISVNPMQTEHECQSWCLECFWNPFSSVSAGIITNALCEWYRYKALKSFQALTFTLPLDVSRK